MRSDVGRAYDLTYIPVPINGRDGHVTKAGSFQGVHDKIQVILYRILRVLFILGEKDACDFFGVAILSCVD